MAEKINIIVLEPGKNPRYETIENTLREFQRIVDGYIEVTRLSSNRVIVSNEEGMMLCLRPNRTVDDLRTMRIPINFCGTIVMARTNGDRFVSVNVSDVDWINSHSKFWEI